MSHLNPRGFKRMKFMLGSVSFKVKIASNSFHGNKNVIINKEKE